MESEMDDWRPIATAPTGRPDGNEHDDPPRLLVWVANGGRNGKGECDFGCVYRGKRTGRLKPKAFHYSGEGWHITHWQPEPKGPTQTASVEDEG